jgi:surface antigen
VGPNDTLDSVAARFQVRAEQIRWSNLQPLASTSELEPGQTLVIPPVAGVVVTVRHGDSLRRLADTWHVGRGTIQSYNALRDPNHDVKPGKLLVLPGARAPGLPDSRTPPPTVPLTDKGTSPPFNVGGPNPGGSSYDGYPSGQCTYYVASRVDIPWMGDAGTWFPSAQSQGWAVGSTPRQGAVMVTWENELYGHVAYVEHAYNDGSWLVSEMNYVGEDVVDQRLIRPGGVPLLGFIYPPRSLGR